MRVSRFRKVVKGDPSFFSPSPLSFSPVEGKKKRKKKEKKKTHTHNKNNEKRKKKGEKRKKKIGKPNASFFPPFPSLLLFRLAFFFLLLLLVGGDLLGATETTGAASGNETDLGTVGGIAADCRRMTNVLVVSSSVGMLDGVHSHTTHTRPLVTLHAVLVVGAAGLHDRLLGTASAGNDSDHTTAAVGDHLAGARGELDAGLALLGEVGDDGGVVARGLGELGPVAGALLNIAHDGTLGHGAEGQHVADIELGLLATVDKLASVHALSTDEELLAHLEPVGITELHNSKGSTTAGVVDDLLDYSLDVSGTLGEVESAELSGTLAVLVVRLEDTPAALTLRCFFPEKKKKRRRWMRI